MQLLGYPYTIKNSDLTSFSGGRQLGTVLSILDSIIVLISYSQNIDVNRLIGRDYVFLPNDGNIIADNNNDDTVDMDKVLPRIHDLVPVLDWEIDDNDEFNGQKENHFKILAEQLYGTEEQTKQLRNDINDLEQTQEKLDEKLSHLSELPNKRQELLNNIENCQQYIEEMINHIKANMILKNALNEEIKSNQEEMIKLKAENKRLESMVESQKHLVIEYKYAIERKKHLQEEIEQAEQENQDTKAMISTLTLDIKREHSKLELLMRDISEMISLICEMYDNSKIHRFLMDGNSIMKFNKNVEWLEFIGKFEQFKLAIDQNQFDEIAFDSMKMIMMKNLKDLHMHLIEQATILKTKISLEVVYVNQKQQKQCDKKRQELKEREGQLKQMWEQKNSNEFEHQNEMDELNMKIEKFKSKIIDMEKLLTTNTMSTNELDEKINNMDEKIVEKKYQIINDYRECHNRFEQYESELMAKIDERKRSIEQQNRHMEKILIEMKRI
ncbi:hypothetical protein BLA29_003789 [Euroglyphus maynei]|uniref:Uncharacterized protein n=1 Tax=Euroglyphus maynei TaxID=6958 RepID=A0A1Y3BN83_EURMA|nr:hypothetical protein BLA29_003789 [Euroglyphus maynei]